jgi:hypothetical protein
MSYYPNWPPIIDEKSARDLASLGWEGAPDVSQFYEPGDTLQTGSGTSLPGTCTVGELYWDTDADTNGSLYGYRATDVWKEVDDDGGAGGGAPADAQYYVAASDGTLTAEIVITGLSTLNGIAKADGAGGFSAATSGTDYAPATSGSSILKGDGAGWKSVIKGGDAVARTCVSRMVSLHLVPILLTLFLISTVLVGGWAGTAHAQDTQLALVVGQMGGAPDSPPAGFSCSGDSELICDNFDGGSTSCGDDANSNCWESWTKSGTQTVNNQATGLEGTYGKYVDAVEGDGKQFSYATFTAQNEVYGFAEVSWVGQSLTNGTAMRVLAFTSSDGGNERCSIKIKRVAATYYWCPSQGDTEGTCASSPAPAVSTTYYIWFYFLIGSGSDGICQGWISTTTTTPGSPTISITDGGSMGQAARIDLGAFDTSSTGELDQITFDKVRVATTAFGDNGE